MAPAELAAGIAIGPLFDLGAEDGPHRPRQIDPRVGSRLADGRQQRARTSPPTGAADDALLGGGRLVPRRWFDRLRDRNQPDQLTTRDLVAVSMLGTAIDPHAAAWILDEGARPISDLLAQIPSGIELWLIDEAVLADDAPLAQLMRLLQHGRWPDSIGPNGIGLAGATKLLAAKRPDLVPIYDVHVEVRLQPTPGQFIRAMRSGLSTPEQRIGPAIAVAPIDRAQPDGIELSFLRRIDIALWMLHHEATLAARQKRSDQVFLTNSAPGSADATSVTSPLRRGTLAASEHADSSAPFPGSLLRTSHEEPDMTTERDRHQLYQEVKEVLSVESADELMSYLPPVGWADVATKDDIGMVRGEIDSLRAEMRSEFTRVRGESAELRGEITNEIGRFRADVGCEFAQVRSESAQGFAELRSDFVSAHTELRSDFSDLRSDFADMRHETSELRGETAELRGALIALMGLIRGGFAAVGGRFAGIDGRFAGIEGEFKAVHSEIGSIGVQMAATYVRLRLWSILTMLSIVGTAAAAVALTR